MPITSTLDREKSLIGSVPKGLLIDGAWRPASSMATFEVEDPATGRSIAAVADGTSADAVAALDAADRVQRAWARTPPRERSEILRRGFEMITARADDFALLMTLEMGKPLAEAYSEVTYGAEFLRWYSEEAVRDYGRYVMSPDGRNRILVQRRPVGPCLLITPWNFPLAMATRKVAPAIAAGCTIILKPANLTPLTSHLFAQVMLDAGLPDGVLNVVSSSDPAGISDPLIADRRLRKVSFTGSTAVGRRLLAAASRNVLRTSMELGGNAPFVVFDDADLVAAVDGAMLAKMRNMGEACTAANRFLVHESVADEFGRLLGARMSALVPAPGTDPASTLGPIIHSAARDEIHRLVREAVDAGATVQSGGSKIDGKGYFYEPTVLTGVPSRAEILRQEIFGPVVSITTFSTEEQVVSMANDTEYGLAAYLFTRDYNRLLRLAEQIEVGMVGFNAGMLSNTAAPFGGVKQSGIGREGGAEGLGEYTSAQYVCIADPFTSGGLN